MAGDRLAVAYHEAAHAVVACKFGHYLGRTTIVPDPETGLLGLSLAEGEWADGSRDEEVAISYYAGLAGERLVRADATVEQGCWDDYARAEQLVRDPVHQLELQARAAQLVVDYRGEIDDLAAALLKDGTLSPDETDIVIGCRADGKDWRRALAAFRAFRDAP